MKGTMGIGRIETPSPNSLPKILDRRPCPVVAPVPHPSRRGTVAERRRPVRRGDRCQQGHSAARIHSWNPHGHVATHIVPQGCRGQGLEAVRRPVCSTACRSLHARGQSSVLLISPLAAGSTRRHQLIGTYRPGPDGPGANGKARKEDRINEPALPLQRTGVSRPGGVPM